jgi:Cu/Zn superoxide dismutase
MNHRFSPLVAGATAFALTAAIALAQSSPMMDAHSATMTKVTLSPQNNSGQHGTATLVQKGSDVVVTVSMTGIPAGVAEPTHIHPGTCAKLNPAPKYPLTNSKNGTTTTTVKNVKLSSLMGGNYAINVHNAKNLSIYVACGDIK